MKFARVLRPSFASVVLVVALLGGCAGTETGFGCAGPGGCFCALVGEGSAVVAEVLSTDDGGLDVEVEVVEVLAGTVSVGDVLRSRLVFPVAEGDQLLLKVELATFSRLQEGRSYCAGDMERSGESVSRAEIVDLVMSNADCGTWLMTLSLPEPEPCDDSTGGCATAPGAQAGWWVLALLAWRGVKRAR
ncbi:MAG: hypothetical protein AAGE52_18965 [Myxococcota bacterium]